MKKLHHLIIFLIILLNIILPINFYKVNATPYKVFEIENKTYEDLYNFNANNVMLYGDSEGHYALIVLYGNTLYLSDLTLNSTIIINLNDLLGYGKYIHGYAIVNTYKGYCYLILTIYEPSVNSYLAVINITSTNYNLCYYQQLTSMGFSGGGWQFRLLASHYYIGEKQIYCVAHFRNLDNHYINLFIFCENNNTLLGYPLSQEDFYTKAVISFVDFVNKKIHILADNDGYYTIYRVDFSNLENIQYYKINPYTTSSYIPSYFQSITNYMFSGSSVHETPFIHYNGSHFGLGFFGYLITFGGTPQYYVIDDRNYYSQNYKYGGSFYSINNYEVLTLFDNNTKKFYHFVYYYNGTLLSDIYVYNPLVSVYIVKNGLMFTYNAGVVNIIQTYSNNLQFYVNLEFVPPIPRGGSTTTINTNTPPPQNEDILTKTINLFVNQNLFIILIVLSIFILLFYKIGGFMGSVIGLCIGIFILYYMGLMPFYILLLTIIVLAVLMFRGGGGK